MGLNPPDVSIPDRGLEMAAFDYVCRVCTKTKPCYVLVERTATDERYVDGWRYRLTRMDCETCGVERPFVMDVPFADAAGDPEARRRRREDWE